MNLNRDYNKLYQHWLKEFEQAELTPLSQEDFEYYKEISAEINKVKVEKTKKLKQELIESYKRNINFLFDDLLKIRQLKIINTALAYKDINLENVIEAEKLLFQNLTASFKGYKKVKNLMLSEDVYSLEQETEIKETEKKAEIIVEKLQSEDKMVLETTEFIEESIQEENIDYNYVVIRFLKKAPALVGIDLLNYGPFEEDEIVNLPLENARILINEKFAEKIDLS